jgi:hypothetical protein
MNPTPPRVALGLAVLALSGAASALAQAPASAPAPAAAPPPAGPAPAPSASALAPARIVSRRVLPDGTTEIRYEDGTSRRVSKERLTQSLAPDAAGEDALPSEPPAWLADPETGAAFRAALKEYYAYRISGLQHRRRVFEWQLRSSKVIFATVLILVASGVVFAAVQFYVGLKRAVGSRAAPERVTELDLSTTGVKVSSPILGVIILVISLGFFYLYLVYVYPISEIW